MTPLKLGNHAEDRPIYWKYGCSFYEQKTCSQGLIESQWDDPTKLKFYSKGRDKGLAGAGTIRLRVWGERANDLIEQLIEALQKVPADQLPEIKRIVSRLDQAEISAHAELPNKGTPEIFVSYAWGDDSSVQARQRTEVVDRLCQSLAQEGWNVLRDKKVMRPGELISGFMKRFGRADHVIVVLSNKYLQSAYCMTELHSIYQQLLGEKEDFLRRFIPLTLQDARIGTWRDRVEHAKYWQAEFQAMELSYEHLGEQDFKLYKAIKDWHNRVGDMLAYINDVLHPHGFEAIVENDFAALRHMLQRALAEPRS